MPSSVAEIPGEGIVGHVEGRRVIVGGDRFVVSRVGRMMGDHPAKGAGSVLVAVVVDGHMAGHLVMFDPLREGAGAMLDGLRAGLTPDQKVLLVLSERKQGPVMMVGDGVNDAPRWSLPTSASP